MPTVVNDDLTSAPDRTPPNPWMNAITAKVNALWAAFHQRSPVRNSTPVVVVPDPSDVCAQQTRFVLKLRVLVNDSCRSPLNPLPVDFGVLTLTLRSILTEIRLHCAILSLILQFLRVLDSDKW